MFGIIVVGHGEFAYGMRSAVELISGSPEDFHVVSFMQDDSSADLASRISNKIEVLESCKGILIFTDLVGGTPFKESVLQALENQEDRIRVFAGSNLGMILEATQLRNQVKDIEELVVKLKETGISQVYLLDNKELREG